MSDDLPEGWAEAPLNDLLKPGGLFDGPFGSNLKSGDYTDTGVRVIRLENVANLRFVEDRETYISEAKYRDLAKHAVGAGDIIVGSFVDGAVRVCVLPELGTKAIAKADCFTVRTESAVADRSFVALQLGTNATRDALVEEIHGVTRPRITTRQLRDFRLQVAPLPEQHRIVAQVDALLEQVNRARERLDGVPLILKRFRQAVLAAACSGRLTEEWREDHPGARAPVLPEPAPAVRRGRRGANLSGDDALLVDELPELPESWRYVRIDRLTEPGTVITYGIVLPGPEILGGVPYVRGQDVEDGKLRTEALRHTTKEIASKHPRASLLSGDILLCIIRNLRIAIVPDGLDGANITQGMVRIRTSPALVLRDFVASYLMSPLAQGWMKSRYYGMDMPRINVEDARAIPVALPPIDEQVEIVRQVEKLFALADAIERRVQAASARADRLPQTVLSKAFAGELVPTEADLARAEGRTYETAAELLARIAGERASGVEAGAVRRVPKGGRSSKRRAG